MSSLLSTLGSYCTTRAMHLRALLLTLDTSSFPSKESSNSAAGHSGVLTVVSRSCRKFANSGLPVSSHAS